MKGLVSMKWKLEVFKIVALIEEYSLLSLNKLPPNIKYLVSFKIPCSVRQFCTLLYVIRCKRKFNVFYPFTRVWER